MTTINELIDAALKDNANNDAYERIIDAVDKAVIDAALKKNHGNQTRSAIELGVNRGTFRKKILKTGSKTVRHQQ